MTMRNVIGNMGTIETWWYDGKSAGMIRMMI